MTTRQKYSNLEAGFPDFCYKNSNTTIENNNAFETMQVVGF